VPADDDILAELDACAVVVRPDRAILGVARDSRRLLELVALIGERGVKPRQAAQR
jgi:hypothetical protein